MKPFRKLNDCLLPSTQLNMSSMQVNTLTQISCRLEYLSISCKDPRQIIISGMSVDSRLINPGNLFFALKGAKVDGHQHLAEAFAKGAAAAVVQNHYNGPDFGLPLVRVEDPLIALQSLARETLRSHHVKVVGVTGSLGKTTTKDFIATLLREKYIVAASPGNSNSQIGLPLSILNHMRGNEDVLVQEMGMTHANQISALVEIAPPNVAVITSVALVHACNFPSIEAIGLAKGEIFSHKKTSLGILSRDISNFSELAEIGTCPKLSFSTNKHDSDYFVRDSIDGLQIYCPEGRVLLPVLPIPGRHNLHNFMAALAVARNLNLSWEQILSGITKLQLPERRFEQVEKQGILFVNDSYNASVMSVKAALECLPKPSEGGKTIAVIGQMLELGRYSDDCHLDIAEAALGCVDRMICIGAACGPIVECWTSAQREVVWVKNLDDVVGELKRQVVVGDVVLLKGASANELWKVLEAFDVSVAKRL